MSNSTVTTSGTWDFKQVYVKDCEFMMYKIDCNSNGGGYESLV